MSTSTLASHHQEELQNYNKLLKSHLTPYSYSSTMGSGAAAEYSSDDNSMPEMGEYIYVMKLVERTRGVKIV